MGEERKQRIASVQEDIRILRMNIAEIREILRNRDEEENETNKEA